MFVIEMELFLERAMEGRGGGEGRPKHAAGMFEASPSLPHPLNRRTPVGVT